MAGESMIRLMEGDCLDRMKEIEDGSVDLTVTSPPYDNLRTYNDTLNDWTQEKWQEIIRELFRVTKQGGVVVWVVGDATINGSETGTSFRQALYAMDCGFRLHDTMIWRKNNFSNPSRTRYHQVFEFMFVWSKGSPSLNPIMDRKNVFGGKVGSYGANTFTKADGTKGRRERKINSDYGMRHNVWDVKTCGQSGEVTNHPAAFPEALARDHILSWSNPGDLVLDPFLGSGTTGKMAIQTGRQFIGIERDETYFNIAKDRIDNAVEEEKWKLI